MILGAEKSAIGKRKVQQRGRFLQGMMHYWKVGGAKIRESGDQRISGSGDARRGCFRFDGLPILLFRSWDVGSWALRCTLELCMEASSRLVVGVEFLVFSPSGSVPGTCGLGFENLTMVDLEAFCNLSLTGVHPDDTRRISNHRVTQRQVH